MIVDEAGIVPVAQLRALTIDLTGKAVGVATLDDVISFKEWANRPKCRGELTVT